jgi:flagellar hook-associated protein 1 FlgK
VADLLALLTNSATGLAAHQAALATAGHNIQNANTPGYTRQVADLEAQSPAQLEGSAFIGRGVTLETISQVRDPFIEKQLPMATGAQAGSTAESDALGAITALNPDGAGSLTAAIGNFYTAMQGLAQNPGDGGLRLQALAATNGLAQGFNSASSALEAARTGLDAQLTATVSSANQAAASVALLNRQIQTARASGAEPNDLIDARQVAANTLSQLTGATQIPTGTGDIQMMLPGGGALVSGNLAGKLSLLPDPSNSGHLAFQLTRPDGSGPTAVAGSALGGTAGGVLKARDGAILTAENGLDQLAFDLTSAVNTVHAAGVGLDGVTGRNLLVAQATVAGAASRMAVDPALAGNPDALAAASSAGALPGDGSNLAALVATESTPLTAGRNVAATLSGIVTDFGASAATATNVAAQNQTVLANLKTQRDSVSGVSIDEEMINLTKAQTAYNAVAKVIVTANDMLATLMTIGGTP